MIKSVLIGVWACCVLISAHYGAQILSVRQDAHATEALQASRETRTTRELNIPSLVGGSVRGYIVAKFSFVIDKKKAAASSLEPDSFVEDEAFKYIYANTDVDPEHLDKVDLKKLTAAIIDGANKRLNADLLVDMGIQEFTYMANTENKARP